MVEVVCGVGGMMFAEVEGNILALESEFKCDRTFESNGKSSPWGRPPGNSWKASLLKALEIRSLGEELGIAEVLNR